MSFYNTPPPMKPAKGFKMPPVPENAVVVACIQWLHFLGMQPIRNNTGSFTKVHKSEKTGKETRHRIGFGKKGTGDIICCAKTGRWLEVECKSTDGKQSPEQKERQAHVEAMGGIYILARSVMDLEERRKEILGE